MTTPSSRVRRAIRRAITSRSSPSARPSARAHRRTTAGIRLVARPEGRRPPARPVSLRGRGTTTTVLTGIRLRCEAGQHVRTKASGGVQGSACLPQQPVVVERAPVAVFGWGCPAEPPDRGALLCARRSSPRRIDSRGGGPPPHEVDCGLLAVGGGKKRTASHTCIVMCPEKGSMSLAFRRVSGRLLWGVSPRGLCGNLRVSPKACIAQHVASISPYFPLISIFVCPNGVALPTRAVLQRCRELVKDPEPLASHKQCRMRRSGVALCAILMVRPATLAT